MRLARRYRFSASHRLHAPELSDGENRELYGKCNYPFGHGHDYVVEIAVRGDVDEATGRVIDPGALDALAGREVVARFDHQDLNAQPDFAGAVPTTENLAIAIERRLRAAWPEGWPPLDGVRIDETRRNRIELRRG